MIITILLEDGMNKTMVKERRDRKEYIADCLTCLILCMQLRLFKSCERTIKILSFLSILFYTYKYLMINYNIQIICICFTVVITSKTRKEQNCLYNRSIILRNLRVVSMR